MFRRLLLLPLAWMAFGCAHSAAPLVIEEDIAFDCSGALDTSPQTTSLRPRRAAPLPQSVDTVGIRVRLYEVDHDAVQLLAGRIAPRVVRATRERVNRALHAAEATRMNTIDLAAPVGGWADAVAIDERAYVSSFEYTAVQGAAIADPQIDVVESGIVVSLSPSAPRSDGVVELSLALVVGRLASPLARLPFDVAWSRVEIEVPLRFTQRLEATVPLASDSAIVVSGLGATDGRSLAAVIERGGGAPARY